MRRFFAVLVLGLVLTTPADAGIVIILESAIDASRVTVLERRGDDLLVRCEGDDRLIELPPGALEAIVRWAEKEPDGPVVVSVDSAFVVGFPDYFPPAVGQGLGAALIDYDIYAHEIAIGGRANAATHPLVLAHGAEALPENRHLALLDPENRDPRAAHYRHLTSLYASVPGCFGQLTLRAIAGDEATGFPVRLEVESHRWLVTSKWYRGNDVPSAWERLIAAEPFVPLRRDMEARWDVYRERFRGLDELSSIVEAMAVLREVRRDHPKKESLWEAFDSARSRDVVDAATRVSFRAPFLDSRPWFERRTDLAGSRIDSLPEADAALADLVDSTLGFGSGSAGSDDLAAIESWAKRSPALAARLALWRALHLQEDPLDPDSDVVGEAEAKRRVESFLAQAKALPDGFRLRAQGYRMLARTLRRFDGPIVELLRNERAALIADFKSMARRRLASQAGDLAAMEDLIQCVYSVGLISLVRDGFDGMIADREFALVLADVHHARALAPQVGFELAFQHAHFRFLGHLIYLRRDDADLRRRVHAHRAEIAEVMGLVGWREAWEEGLQR